MRRVYLRLVTLATLAAAAGCSGSNLPGADGSTDVDSGIDGGVVDAADAFSPERDSGTDEDGDGIATAIDCDDRDVDVGRNATRDCASTCAAGLERCTDGSWAACDAPTDCACDAPGDTRTVDCGMCGIGSQTCGADGRWSVPSACFDEGECAAGAIERDIARCGDRQRICDDTCAWRAWSELVPPRECEPGDETVDPAGCPAGQVRTLTCSAACTFEETTACEARCLRAPRSSRTGADPVCIPAGEFVLGRPGGSSYSPERIVYISEFYIDRNPVTKARYDMCIAAGVCPISLGGAGYDAIPADSYASYVREGAPAFCRWDGGVLVDDLQWEKAARGPSPDRRLHSWGTEVDNCTFHPRRITCATRFFAVATSFPAAVSPYGVHLMGSVPEITSTDWRSGWTWLPSGSDPAIPDDYDANLTARGANWLDASEPAPGDPRLESAIARASSTLSYSAFRCAY